VGKRERKGEKWCFWGVTVVRNAPLTQGGQGSIQKMQETAGKREKAVFK
jgi:hypothetical protein